MSALTKRDKRASPVGSVVFGVGEEVCDAGGQARQLTSGADTPVYSHTTHHTRTGPLGLVLDVGGGGGAHDDGAGACAARRRPAAGAGARGAEAVGARAATQAYMRALRVQHGLCFVCAVCAMRFWAAHPFV